MGITRGAVKSHTARGMTALHAALEQELRFREWNNFRDGLCGSGCTGLSSPTTRSPGCRHCRRMCRVATMRSWSPGPADRSPRSSGLLRRGDDA